MDYRDHGPWLPVLKFRLLPNNFLLVRHVNLECSARQVRTGMEGMSKLGVSYNHLAFTLPLFLLLLSMDGSSAIIGYQLEGPRWCSFHAPMRSFILVDKLP